jgi:cytidine deaminase
MVDPTNMPALIAGAIAAQQRAYAPYSKFHVGAIVCAGSHEFIGVNVENASYGLCICAERNAVGAAVVAGHRELDRCVVATDASPPSSPCGMCRQVLLEFARDPKTFIVTAVNAAGERRDWRLIDLIPDGFSGRELPTP